ncbi:hypothetical protein [Sulfobacillus thermosulfidooxidans]|uniref:hypothetical protein n=1 Tax=Sulfobacillus thermosulfidooxidans TaxID=28034 RepID=UPI0006B43D7D|nr:hypothetical protein [Sulfobacillus thermosulfidooxidans]
MAQEIPVYLRIEDVDDLLRWCEAQWESPVQPSHWLWWRIQQACTHALITAADRPRRRHGMDRATH